MIPLNRPCLGWEAKGEKRSFFQEKFSGYQNYLMYASRDGLNTIYKYLFSKYGGLRVLVSPLTCFIALYPIVANGHVPVYADINPKTLNIDEKKVVERNDVQVIQIIYLGGNPINLDVILPWASDNKITIVEDCAQAMGATYKEKMLGTFGDYSVFSMVKNVYAIAGGLLFAKQNLAISYDAIVADIVISYKRLKRLLESRVDEKCLNMTNVLYYVLLRLKEGKESLQTNFVRKFKATDEQLIMNSLPSYQLLNNKRLENAKLIMNGIDREKYYIQEEVQFGKSNRNRLLLVSKTISAKDIIQYLRGNGIAANNLTQNYLHGYQPHIKYDNLLGGYYQEQLSVYEELMPRLIAIPNSPSLCESEINFIIEKVNLAI